jgi:hypothetical protein
VGEQLEIGMSSRRYVTVAAVAAALVASLPAFAQGPRAVIELFTSQGCSSCPPADKLLGDFAKDPTLVPLTLPIDTWDYLGWKDTLAQVGHGRRQRAYSQMRGDREVYTPQVVVNGTLQARGSDRAAIEEAIAESRRNAAILSLPLALTLADGRLTVAAPAGRTDAPSAEVWLCPLTKAVEVAIGRGENSGHTFTYHNVVRRWSKLGVWNGKAASWTVPVADFKTADVDAVAVVVQDGVAAQPGTIRGAAMISLDEHSLSAAAVKP